MVIKDALGAREQEHYQAAVRMISLNVGAALYLVGVTGNIKQGISEAQDVISNGLASAKLMELIKYTQGQ